MQYSYTLAVLMLLSQPTLAALEDGLEACSDGLDNDGDGFIDCDETECVSSLESCGLLPGPIAVGLGAEAAPLIFDVPMVTRGGTAASSLMVVDANGPAAGQDDLIVGRGIDIALFRNIATTGYLSLPQDPVVRTGVVAGSPNFNPGGFAAGDFSGDGRADLVVVSALSMRRFIGSAAGNGTFLSTALINPLPGPGGGLPAVVGRTVAVANTRLRLYDQRCTSSASGFPTNETFVAGGLCASVDLPGSSPTPASTTSRSTPRLKSKRRCNAGAASSTG